MEVITDNLVGQELITLENIQIKLEQQLALPDNAKKVLTVSCTITGQETNVKDNDVIMSGNICTRIIFINEFDKFDSKDTLQAFDKKITIKELNTIGSVHGQINIANYKWEVGEQNIQITNILNTVVKGVKTKTTRLITDLTGEVEVRKKEEKFLTLHNVVTEKFEVTANLELDKNCEGVLGVDANAMLKDVVAGDGNVTIKGVVVANAVCLKTNDDKTAPYNFENEIDFSKIINVAGLTAGDLAHATVTVDNVTMHVENGTKGAMLALKLMLIVHGYTYAYQNYQTVVDAICFDKELTLTTSPLVRTEVLSQINTCIDLESNLNLPPQTPYLTRVLAVEGMKITQLEITAHESKTMLSGMLLANLLVENEEHVVSQLLITTPWQTHVRTETWDEGCTVQATIIPLSLNVKARRGVELLIDAKLGICVQAVNKKTCEVVTTVTEGNAKVDDGCAIRIMIIGEKESLWDLAKRTNLSCEALLQQNPNLQNGCTPGEHLVVYRHEKISL